MRTQNSMRNIFISLLTQMVMVLLGFISRKVFMDNLGEEYLGVNGLLTNILSMMSLVEGGIGVSIVYNLYKPLAENDEKRVLALVQLYKKLYGILAIVIFLISLGLYPFLKYVINDVDEVKYIGVVYFIFVAKNIISYFNAHKWSLINADQKGYIIAKYDLFFNIITTVIKIIVLKVTGSYVLYILIEVLVFVVQNIWNGRIVNQRYPYIKSKEKYEVDKETKNNLTKNIKALFLHKFGGWCVFGTDNILISALISTRVVGLYSNYTMIIGQLGGLVRPFILGIEASVGNLIAVESKEKQYEVFKIINLVAFWVYSFSAIFLYNLLEPFINWWLGDGLLLTKAAFIVVLINFYITGLRTPIDTFKAKAGIFTQDRYMPLVEAAINLGTSFILVKYLGIVGIFLGTTISSLAVPVWIQSYIVYKKVFNVKINKYFRRYLFFVILTLFVGVGTTFACSLITVGGFTSLVIKGIICVVTVNLCYVAVFFRSCEFKYLLSVGKSIIKKKSNK